MNCGYCKDQTDYGPKPYVTNITETASDNQNFRTAVWTGEYLQMTYMSILPCGEIGPEIHEETDQLIRVERGEALVKIGQCETHPDCQSYLSVGDAVFVPAGTWHNVINVGRESLKVSSIYAPPHHRRGTVQPTRLDAKREEM